MFRRLNYHCLKSKFVLPDLVVDGGVVDHVDISVAGDARLVGPNGRVSEVHHVIMLRYLELVYTKRNKREYFDSIYCYKMNILSVTTPDTNCLMLAGLILNRFILTQTIACLPWKGHFMKFFEFWKIFKRKVIMSRKVPLQMRTNPDIVHI